MKKYIFLLVFCCSIFSCSDIFNGSYSNIRFVVKSDSDTSSGKVTTFISEAGYFKTSDSFNVSSFPFSKEYKDSQIHTLANIILKYQDKSVNLRDAYTITLQIFNKNTLLEEKTFTIEHVGQEVNIMSSLNV